MWLVQNSGYGAAQLAGMPYTTGRIFVVAASGDANFQNIDELYTTHYDGVIARHSTVTAALAQCVADRGDVIVLSPDFDTAFTAAELLSAETKWVAVHVAGTPASGIITANRATAALPATADDSLFTITGRVELISVIGVVTTIIQTQANATLLKVNPTVGADVDICAANDISADAVGTVYNITGTLADAMVATTSGAWVFQAAPIFLEAWVLELECAATNTGSVKWSVQYRAIDPWARMIAA